MTIDYNTPLTAVEELKRRLNGYVSENSRDWSGVGVNIDKMDFQNAITIIIAMEREFTTLILINTHTRSPTLTARMRTDRPNWQDWGGRWMRRTAFMRYLKTTLEELDISYSMPVQPVLLPKGPPPFPPQMQSQLPHIKPPSNRDSLGNAGSFQGSEWVNRAPGPQLIPGNSHF